MRPERDNLRAAIDFFVEMGEIELGCAPRCLLEQYWVDERSRGRACASSASLDARSDELAGAARAGDPELGGAMYMSGPIREGARLGDEAWSCTAISAKTARSRTMLARDGGRRAASGDLARARLLTRGEPWRSGSSALQRSAGRRSAARRELVRGRRESRRRSSLRASRRSRRVSRLHGGRRPRSRRRLSRVACRLGETSAAARRPPSRAFDR